MTQDSRSSIRLRWVVDANVLYAAAEENATALVLLMSILLEDGLGLDTNHEIDIEYQGALDKHHVVSHWFHRMHTDGRCQRYPGQVPPPCAKHLLKAKFHKNDWKYVAVAIQTEDRLLVTENLKEHHFDPAVCKYLREAHAVRVLCAADACGTAEEGA